jgi:hypothetical protein
VYTRQTYAEPLKDRTADATDVAMRKVLNKMPNHAENAAVTTDEGKEFAHLDTLLKDRHSIHRLKVGRNDIAVVDSYLQQVKRKLANALANQGGSWEKNLPKVIKALNENPRAVVHGAPINADQPDAQGFAVLQDQANNFVKNFAVAKAREREFFRTGAVRPAISDGSRILKPKYGGLV